MSILCCSLCLPDKKELEKLNTDLARIDSLYGRDLASTIITLLTSNLVFIKSISSEIEKLIIQGHFPCDQILRESLPYNLYIYSSEIEEKIEAINLTEKRKIAREMRILNLKLRVLSGNIANLTVQLSLTP